MKHLTLKILCLLFVCGLVSCNTVKRVAEGDSLLVGNDVLVNGRKNHSEAVTGQLYQKPNRSLLGIPVRLHLYNAARLNIDSLIQAKVYDNPKKMAWKTKLLSRKQLEKELLTRKGFNAWLKRAGEAPVIVNDKANRRSVSQLENYFINNGWFDVKAGYQTQKLKHKRARVTYRVTTGMPYAIDTIYKKITSPLIELLYEANQGKAFIKKGQQYATENFEKERERISNELRNNGRYHFSEDYVSFEIDTIGTGKKMRIGVQIKNRAIEVTTDSIIRKPFKVFKVDKVNIFTDNRLQDILKPFTDSLTFQGYKLYSRGKLRYRPKVLTEALFITPKSIFKSIDRTHSYRYISNLQTFRYPTIRYQETTDSTLTANVYLSPLKKYGLNFRSEVSQSNIQSIGIAFSPSLSIRNFFNGAETLQVSATGSVGSSKDGKQPNDPLFDINEMGVDLKLKIPRFLSPFNTDKIIPRYMSPSTQISLSTSNQLNIGLDRQTLSGVFKYRWTPSRFITNTVDVFNLQYVRNKNSNDYYNVYPTSFDDLNSIAQTYNTSSEVVDANNNLRKDIVSGGLSGADLFGYLVFGGRTDLTSTDIEYQRVYNVLTRKERLTEDYLIFSSNYRFLRDTRKTLSDKTFSIIEGKIELAGNLLRAFSKSLNLDKNEFGNYKLFNVPFSQYIKLDFSYVNHWPLGAGNRLSFRIFSGIGIPLRNSPSMPFSKSYFAGGANDNRAWKPYTLGPGDSNNFSDFNEANFKIACSTEYRFSIFGGFEGAFFVDAGNIWNTGTSSEQYDRDFNENTTFKGFKSLENVAIGSGFGLRYDFNFFVFRFDVGFKTYDPAYQDSNRWLNDYNFSHAVYNIGINYPF